MSSFRCPQCGFLNFAAAETCKRCKIEFAQSANEYEAATAVSVEAATQIHIAQPTHVRQISVPPAPREERKFPPRAAIAQPENFDENHGENNYGNNYEAETVQALRPPPRFERNAPPTHFVGHSAKQKSGLAIGSLVFGIIGMFTGGLLLVGSIIGVIMGGVAVSKSNKNPAQYGGKGFAIAGIVLNCIAPVSLFFVGIIAAIAIPNLLAARRAANEGSAISQMRVLMAAEQTFAATRGAGRCGDLADLDAADLIDSTLASGRKNGYEFTIVKKANACELFATPLVSDGAAKSGNRSFYLSTDEGELRAAEKRGAPADKNDPMLRLMNSSTKRNSRDDY